MGIGFLIYVVLAAFGIYLAIFYLEFASLGIAGILILVPLFMLGLLFYLCKHARFQVLVKNPVAEISPETNHAKAKVDISLMNTSHIFPIAKALVVLQYENLFSGEMGIKRIRFSVDSDTVQTEEEVEIEVKHCGNIKITVKRAKIYDYLGIFSRVLVRNKKVNNIVVLPPLKEVYLEDERFIAETDTDSGRYSPYKPGNDPSEVFAVRDYKEGDRLSQIHWKLSGKNSSLMVKEYSLPLTKSTVVFVDFCVTGEGKEKLKKIDLLMQSVYSMAIALIEKEIPLRFYWYNNHENEMKTHLVEKEDDLMWVFREMFQCKMTLDEEELINAYVGWGLGKPHENGLYITVTDGNAAEAARLDVKRMYIINALDNR